MVCLLPGVSDLNRPKPGKGFHPRLGSASKTPADSISYNRAYNF